MLIVFFCFHVSFCEAHEQYLQIGVGNFITLSSYSFNGTVIPAEDEKTDDFIKDLLKTTCSKGDLTAFLWKWRAVRKQNNHEKMYNQRKLFIVKCDQNHPPKAKKYETMIKTESWDAS